MFLKYNIYTILWAVLMLFMVLMPGDLLPDAKAGSVIGFDKLVHTSVFSILILLMIVGFSKQYDYLYLRYYAVGFSFAISFTYGLATEMAQAFIPGRGVEIFDILANTTGCLIGIGLFYLMYDQIKANNK